MKVRKLWKSEPYQVKSSFSFTDSEGNLSLMSVRVSEHKETYLAKVRIQDARSLSSRR